MQSLAKWKRKKTTSQVHEIVLAKAGRQVHKVVLAEGNSQVHKIVLSGLATHRLYTPYAYSLRQAKSRYRERTLLDLVEVTGVGGTSSPLLDSVPREPSGTRGERITFHRNGTRRRVLRRWLAAKTSCGRQAGNGFWGYQ